MDLARGPGNWARSRTKEGGFFFVGGRGALGKEEGPFGAGLGPVCAFFCFVCSFAGLEALGQKKRWCSEVYLVRALGRVGPFFGFQIGLSSSGQWSSGELQASGRVKPRPMSGRAARLGPIFWPGVARKRKLGGGGGASKCPSLCLGAPTNDISETRRTPSQSPNVWVYESFFPFKPPKG